MGDLKGKVVVVAGGAGRIGTATSLRLAAGGASVVVGDADEAAAAAVAARITAEGGQALGVGVDIADEASVVAFFEAGATALGAVHGVHLNAADTSPGTIGRDGDVLSTPLEVFDRTIEVNLRGYVIGVRAAIPHLLDAGGGALVLTSSADSFEGLAERAYYAMSKAGVNALVRHVATRWGKEGIRANAVAPGLVMGDVTDETPQVQLDLRAAYLSRMPSPRIGRGDDIAGAVAFLLSDDAEWITGQVLSVDGGLLLR